MQVGIELCREKLCRKGPGNPGGQVDCELRECPCVEDQSHTKLY